jgi:cytochrome c556
MNKSVFSITLTLVLGASLALPAHSQVKPDVLVKQRQAAMALQGKYFGPMAGMAQGKIPYDAKIVGRNAGYLEVLSKMPWDGFAASTKDVKSAALPAVFTDTAKFKDAANRLETETGKRRLRSRQSARRVPAVTRISGRRNSRKR